MAGRKVFNEQDARRCLAAAKASQASLVEWSRAHGVDGRSLNLWRVNLERRGAPRQCGPLKMVELVPVATSPSGTRGPFRLHIGGVELEVDEDFDEPALRRLVGVLKSC